MGKHKQNFLLNMTYNLAHLTNVRNRIERNAAHEEIFKIYIQTH